MVVGLRDSGNQVNAQFAHLWALRKSKCDQTGEVPTYIAERLDALPGYAIPKGDKLTLQYDIRDWVNERIASFTSTGLPINRKGAKPLIPC